MGLDIYAGTLTRYYSHNWKTVVQQWAEENGYAFNRITPDGESADNEEEMSPAEVQAAVENIAYIAALIAVNLAVMNLLPLPALDGGRIFFLIINAATMLLFRKQVPAKYENYIHFAGLILLLALMVVLVFSDVGKLIH